MDARQQIMIAELTQSVLADMGLLCLVQQAVTHVTQVLQVQAGAVWELLPDNTALLLQASTGWQADAIGHTTVPLDSTSPLAYLLGRPRPVIIVDWSSETRWSQPYVSSDAGAMTSVYVAIGRPEHRFGVLSVDSTQHRTFSDGDITFLQAVANVLSLAIAHVQTDRMIEQRVAEQTRVIEQQWIAAAQDKAVLEERQRLARDLHDSMTQALYGVTLHAQAARRSLAANDVSTAAESLRALQDTAQSVLDEMRLLIFDLRPPILEQAGLSAALQERLEAVEGRANLRTTLNVEGVHNLPPLIEQALYRIAQEALNNALKHAHGSHISVQLQQTPTHVILVIGDDGVGFDPNTERGAGELGLRGIEERVTHLGGHYKLRSVPGDGTELRVEVPL